MPDSLDYAIVNCQCGDCTICTHGKSGFNGRIHTVDFEKHPDWHVIFEKNLDPKRIIAELEILLNAKIAAGSLLEFAMKDISFPVGRVNLMDMAPMNFYEILKACQEAWRKYLIYRTILWASTGRISQNMHRSWINARSEACFSSAVICIRRGCSQPYGCCEAGISLERKYLSECGKEN